MKKKLLIIGASGHGKVVADIAVKMNNWKKIAFLDDNQSLESILGIDVLGPLKEIRKYIDDWDIFVAVGNNSIRSELFNTLVELKATVPVLIHPQAVVGGNVHIGKGTVIMAGVVINSSTSIGKGCIINTSATIDHDNTIEDYVHLSPGVNTAGNVKVGKNTWVGIGSIIINNIKICSDCIIGAGAVVINDIDENGTFVGNPVRKI